MQAFSPSVYLSIFKGSLGILADAWDNIQQLSGLLIHPCVILQVGSLPLIYWLNS